MLNTQLFANLFVFRKQIGMNPLHNRMMHFCWLHVLTYGKNVNIMIYAILHEFDHLFPGFSQTNHDPGFGTNTLCLHSFQKLQRTLVFSLWANGPVKPWNS